MFDLVSGSEVPCDVHNGTSAVGVCLKCAPMAPHADRPSGVDTVDLERGTLVRLWGDIDEALRDEASRAMAHSLARSAGVVIDTSEVEFIDSSGLAFIFQLFRSGTEEGTAVVLRDPPDLLLDMLDLVGLGGRVTLEFSSR